MNSDFNIAGRFKEQHIIIIGDTILDRYFHGSADRISPEAPVPVFDLKHEIVCLGGAANVALNVSHLSASAHLISVVGDDPHADSLQQLMIKDGLSTDGLVLDKTRCTTVKTRLFAQGQQLIRVDEERRHSINSNTQNAILSHLKQQLQKKPQSSIILQDYNKGIFTEELIQNILTIAKEKNTQVFVDPKQKQFFAFEGVDLFKPNLKEITDALKIDSPLDTLEQLQEAAQNLYKKMSPKALMITLGAKGIFISDKTIHTIIPTQQRSIADVCGAGDSVISTVAVAMSAGLPLTQAATLANLAGGQVCEHLGVVPVNLKQLIEEWNSLQL